jgi:hypothetical protein
MERAVSVPTDGKETDMFNTKTLLAAASLAVLTAAGLGTAGAAPWDSYHGHAMRQDMRDFHGQRDLRGDRRIVERERVQSILRFHHLRALGEPSFVRGHYIVRVMGRFGHPRLIEINPYTGTLVGEFHT